MIKSEIFDNLDLDLLLLGFWFSFCICRFHFPVGGFTYVTTVRKHFGEQLEHMYKKEGLLFRIKNWERHVIIRNPHYSTVRNWNRQIGGSYICDSYFCLSISFCQAVLFCVGFIFTVAVSNLKIQIFDNLDLDLLLVRSLIGRILVYPKKNYIWRKNLESKCSGIFFMFFTFLMKKFQNPPKYWN